MSLLRPPFDQRTVALVVLAGSLVLGLCLPPLSELFEPIALPALLFVVIFSLMPFATLERTELISINSGVRRIVLWQQVVLPAIFVALGILCRFPDYVVSLLVVTSCSGALFASPALASLLDLDRRKSLQCMVLTTLTMPVSLYAFLTIVYNGRVALDLHSYGLRIAIFLLLPFLLFAFYRRVARQIPQSFRRTTEAWAHWAVVVALSIFGIGMMHRVTGQLATDPYKVLFFFVLTTMLCAGMLTLTIIVMHRYGMTSALTAGILSGFRNVGLGYALIGDMLGPELAVYVGVGLLPVFTAPMLLRMFVREPTTQPILA